MSGIGEFEPAFQAVQSDTPRCLRLLQRRSFQRQVAPKETRRRRAHQPDQKTNEFR